MTNRLVGSLLLAIALSLSSFAAHAKPDVDRIVVSGGGLPQPVEISGADALRISNPWGGAFAEWEARVPQPSGPVRIFDVVLHARLRGPDSEEIYHFRYALAGDGNGYVYLPGRGEPWYGQNVSIILRNGQDGFWHPASAGWNAVMRTALRK